MGDIFDEREAAKNEGFTRWLEHCHAGYFGSVGFTNIVTRLLIEFGTELEAHAERFKLLTLIEFATYALIPVCTMCIMAPQANINRAEALVLWSQSREYGIRHHSIVVDDPAMVESVKKPQSSVALNHAAENKGDDDDEEQRKRDEKEREKDDRARRFIEGVNQKTRADRDGIIKKVVEQGWPTDYKCEEEKQRFDKVKARLKAWAGEPQECHLFQTFSEEYKSTHNCQNAGLSSEHCGMYGSQGNDKFARWIRETVIPEVKIDPTKTARLGTDAFYARILVPSAAVLMIQDRNGISDLDDAITI